MIIEKYIYHFAIRKSYRKLLKENKRFREFEISPIEIAVFTLSNIVDDDNCAKYDLAWKIVDEISRENKKIFENSESDRLIFFLKLMYLLTTIGTQTVQSVVDLIKDYFGLPEVPLQNFQQGVLLDPWIKQARRYVLSLLIRDDRQKHFRDKKFPQTFAMVTEEIKNLTKIVLSVVRQKFPLCELEEFNNGSLNTDHKDPTLLLFRDRFPLNSSLEEDDLIEFLNNFRESQLTVSPPNFIHRLEEPENHNFVPKKTRATIGKVLRPRRKLTKNVSDEITDRNSSDNLPLTNGSDDLFPLREPSPSVLQRRPLRSPKSPLLGERCFVSVEKLTKQQLSKYSEK